MTLLVQPFSFLAWYSTLLSETSAGILQGQYHSMWAVLLCKVVLSPTKPVCQLVASSLPSLPLPRATGYRGSCQMHWPQQGWVLRKGKVEPLDPGLCRSYITIFCTRTIIFLFWCVSVISIYVWFYYTKGGYFVYDLVDYTLWETEWIFKMYNFENIMYKSMNG